MGFFGFGNFSSLPSAGGGGVSEAKVQELISANNRDYVDKKIDEVESTIGVTVESSVEAVFVEAEKSGKLNDTRIFSTYEEMAATQGTPDTYYIVTTDDEEHGTRYIWDSAKGYVALEDSLTLDDIASIVR